MYQEFESETVGEQPFFSEAERADEFSRRRRRRRSRLGRRRRRPLTNPTFGGFGGYGGYGGQAFPEPPDDSDTDEELESELRGQVLPRRFAPVNRASALRSAGYRRPMVRRHLPSLQSRLGYRTGIRPGVGARYPYRSAGGSGIGRGRYPYGAAGRPGSWGGRYPYRSAAGAGSWPGRYPYRSAGSWPGRYPYRSAGSWDGRYPYRSAAGAGSWVGRYPYSGIWPGRYPYRPGTPYPMWPGLLTMPPPYPMGPPDEGPPPDSGSFGAPPPPAMVAAPPPTAVFDPSLLPPPEPVAAPSGGGHVEGSPGGDAPGGPDAGAAKPPDGVASEYYLEYGGDTPGPSAATTFSPTAVENPGGGRIADKRPPNRAEVVHVRGVGRNQIPLHRLAAVALEALISSARADGLAEPLLRPTSGFRDPARQTQLWQRALQTYGSPQAARRWVAPPGASAHQTGRAIDFHLGGHIASDRVAQLRTLPAYQWMVRNAARFGFYPYANEPWHWEYNPPAGGQRRAGV